MSLVLPIDAHRETIVSELARAGALILSAPTGSGKSTRAPRFVLDSVKGKVLVLEPRRLSARSLAARVASELKTPLGGRVGYRVRFDSKAGKDTDLIYETYGVFVSQLLRDPSLDGVGAVVLDEFHERSLDADLSLGALKSLRTARPDLKLVVMSATLDAGELTKFLPGAARVEVPGRTFPVKITHHPVAASAEPSASALAALRDLAKEGIDGSILVFMPGVREIRRTVTSLTPFCREHGLGLQSLHGSMEPEEQDRALSSGDKRVIVATNVAETGLTVPGVTIVVDSGLHRVAAYDAARGINTLNLARISRANADQRAGRAGRTAPGRCVRLWSKMDEAAMAPSLKPEILRLELSSSLLQAASLPRPVEWLTPPPEAARDSALAALTALGAIDGGRATDKGRALLRWPAPPPVASVLEAARSLGPDGFERACAMAAVFETEGERPPDKPADLGALASELLSGARDELSREAFEVFRQLKRLGEGDLPPAGSSNIKRVWLDAFASRLAARDGEGSFYRLADGRGALLPGVKDLPEVILALEIRERAGGGRARQANVSLYLPFSADEIAAEFPDECAWKPFNEFDDKKGRVIAEERLLFRGVTLARKEKAAGKAGKAAAAGLWAEKYASGELRHPGLDEKTGQVVVRLKRARELYPDMGFPAMDADDWRLVYEELCAGKNSQKDIEREPLIPHLTAYLGPALAAFLDRALPASKKLPSGRVGRFTWFENQGPELSARLGDFVGMKGTLSLCENRVPVTFDILAPNHRTVQKTKDLTSFWTNAYPTIKKEMQRRYPRHPWP